MFLDRMANAFVSPAAVKVDKATERIHSCLAEVNAQIGILLHQRVHEIAESSKELSIKNSELLSEVSKLRTQNTELLERTRRNDASAAQDIIKKDRENLENFRRALGHIPPNCENPEECRKVLCEAFPEAFGEDNQVLSWSGRYTQMTMGLLESTPDYQRWRDCPSPCLLILGGLTESEGQASLSTFSWLSPATSHIARKLAAEDKTIAFFSCHPNTTSKHVTSRVIVSSLLFQLLAWQPSMFRHRMKEFDAIVRSGKWNSEDHYEALECQFGLLERVAKELPASEEIFVILDRIDVCECSAHNILAALQRLISSSHSMMRVAVFMDRIWDSDDRQDCHELVNSDKICRTFGKINWTQERNSS